MKGIAQAWWLVVVCAVSAWGAQKVPEPVIVGPAPANAAGVVTLPDGTLRCYYVLMDAQRVESISSTDGGRTWSEPHLEFNTGRTHHACKAMVDRDGEVHIFYLDKRGQGKINVDYFIDVLHRKTLNGRSAWSEPRRIFQGYTGALRGSVQLPNGRIVVPIGMWDKPGQSVAGTGTNAIGVVYSDDAGQTWHESPVRMRAPTHEGYNGTNYGAVEPCVELLPDGRLWMLFRTQTGYLYESYSRDGVSWSDAAPSRFYSSNSPATLLRLPDDRILLLWNNCATPPRHEGQGVYGGRDALHAAISHDGGRTWQGFREIYRDPTRHNAPPRRGDRGTAYPAATFTRDGLVLVVTGQGEHARRLILFDLDWLDQTQQRDDFSREADAWAAFTEVGPAQRWWRDRVRGAQRAAHPMEEGRYALRLRHPPDRAADGAVWNFPAAQAGRLTLEVIFSQDFAGGQVALLDRFFNPTDDTAVEQAVFLLPLPPSNAPTLEGRHTLELVWDLAKNQCDVFIDGAWSTSLDAAGSAINGVSYLALRAAVDREDLAGWWVESVDVEATQPGSSGR